MEEQYLSFLVENQSGIRLDKYLKEKIQQYSRTFIQGLIKNGQVKVNKKVVLKPGFLLEEGQIVEIFIKPQFFDIKPEKINLDIIFEDDELLVINKKPGMTIFPDRFHQKKTLLGALMYYLGKDADFITENLIVHRLDKGTSGVLIVAKNKAAGDFLKEQFKKRKVEKKYLACVVGQIQPPQAIIEAEIGRNPHQPFKMAVVPDGEGKKAITYYSVIKYFDKFTFLEVWPKTGRTHQIRVHLASIGYPIAGDNVYGSKNILFNLKRPFLHAAMLKITHPKTKTKMTFESPLPNDLKQFLKSIENSN